MKKFDIGMAYDKGEREEYQDYYETLEINENSSLLILADGMGGYAGGEIASKSVVKAFNSNFDTKNKNIKKALKDALFKANESLKNEKQKQPKFKKMGTTLIGFYINTSFIQWISVGDSPIWKIYKDKRLHKYHIKRINKNHSIAGLLQQQLDHGEITQKDIDESPNKHMLTSAVSGENISMIDSRDSIPLDDEDIIILASDGIDILSENEIKEIVLKTKDHATACKNIIDTIKNKYSPNQDNTAVMIISLKDKYKNIEPNVENLEISYSNGNNEKKEQILKFIIIILIFVVSILLLSK